MIQQFLKLFQKHQLYILCSSPVSLENFKKQGGKGRKKGRRRRGRRMDGDKNWERAGARAIQSITRMTEWRDGRIPAPENSEKHSHYTNLGLHSTTLYSGKKQPPIFLKLLFVGVYCYLQPNPISGNTERLLHSSCSLIDYLRKKQFEWPIAEKESTIEMRI